MRGLLSGVVLLVAGCSLKTVAMTSLADTVAEPGTVYARDDDPELVRDALPVMLKIMEQIADGLPRHKGIHLALVRSFTSYAAGFVEEEADRVHETDVERARAIYWRTRKMALRAYRYGLAGLDLVAPGFRKAFEGPSREERARVLGLVKKDDVALLYWSGAALGTAIATSKDDMNLVGQLPLVEKLMARALELDESFDQGAIHEFYVTYDGGSRAAEAKKHYLRALELSKNKKLSSHVSYAEAICVDKQDKQEFTRLLKLVEAFDVDSDPEHRLVNILSQRRARWLLSRTSDLFTD